MTESEYFDALQTVLHPALRDVPKVPGGHYLIEETAQTPFVLSATGLQTHCVINPQGINKDWPCFRAGHVHAHRRCDRIVVAWNRQKSVPQYFLVELKSDKSRGAHQQLGASLAFCHFLHRMVCVGQTRLPSPEFAATTVSTTPFAIKVKSRPSLPPWIPPNIQADCKHMHYNQFDWIAPDKCAAGTGLIVKLSL